MIERIFEASNKQGFVTLTHVIAANLKEETELPILSDNPKGEKYFVINIASIDPQFGKYHQQLKYSQKEQENAKNDYKTILELVKNKD